MARLIVEAIAEDTLASPGNANESYIVVSVTDANGIPVAGLSKPNFGLSSPIMAPGGHLSHINSVYGTASGIYTLNISPPGGYTWKKGTYIWAVQVVRGTDRGQALCSVLMD